MAIRTARAAWEGDLKSGKGTMALGSGAFEGSYSFASRFEEGLGTNPEELLGAAHAGCFSMALAHGLSAAGFAPTQIRTNARVKIEPGSEGFRITSIELDTEAQVPGIDAETFQRTAEATKEGCPVSQALKAVPITLKARLV